jgi:Na+/H+ antiporter NhaA
MTRQHRSSIVRRLRPSPERLAAAAAAYDPGPMLQLQAARSRGERTDAPRRAGGLRRGLSGETGGAWLLVAAIALALVWSNSPWQATYGAFWHAPVALTIGPWTLAADLRTWIAEGLMTLFFLVVGLEAKRERDLGELRERRRLTMPMLAALAGIAASVAVYLAVTSGAAGRGGWGVVVSTDTALALGALTIAAGDRAARLRVFMLTLLVVDDLVALLVISVVYPDRVRLGAAIAAAALLALLLALRAIAARQFRRRGDSTAALTPLSVLVGVALWLALFESGIDPVISGLLVGLLANASRVGRSADVSPNERLQRTLRPWTSKVVVPLFALANAGLHVDGHLLGAAATSPVTWGIVLASVVGKPLGIAIAAAAGAGRHALLGLRAGELGGTALSSGVGFTVSLLIASRAFDGALLDEAKVGILATAVLAPVLAAAALAPLRRPAAAGRSRAAVVTASACAAR